jgi:hypothetical protein
MGVHLGVWKFIPSHSFALPEAWDATPGLPSWPATSQALALVASPRLRLRHLSFGIQHFELIQIMISCNLENENVQMKGESHEWTSFKYLTYKIENIDCDEIPLDLCTWSKMKRQLQQFNYSNENSFNPKIIMFQKKQICLDSRFEHHFGYYWKW